MQEGYIKLHRCILDSSWSRNPAYVSLWVYCLLRANYNLADLITKEGIKVHLDPGQFITSREQISVNTGIEQSKVERILKVFKSEQQIEQQNKGKFRIISILNWNKYQSREQENEQQMNNRRTTDEQQMNTNKKVKKEKEVNPTVISFFDDLWDLYPRKIGRPDALRHYLKTVKTEQDMRRIDLALGYYLDETKNAEMKFIKHGSAWFNSWQNWEVTDAD